MTRPGRIPAKLGGFSMIEVLVSLLIIVFGLLGLAGLQIRIQQAEFESYQRAQALVLLQDMVERIHMHRITATCFRITTNTTNGSPYLGSGSGAVPACAVGGTSNDQTMATQAITEWKNLLKGATEDLGGSSVGAMQGARGCVSYDATTELTDAGGVALSGTGLYTVAISWKGASDTFAPGVNCGNDNTLYVAETRRRVASITFRLAKLN